MIVQGSPEWFAARCGKVTASRVADVIAKTKSGYSASRANYAAELIAERLTGVTAPSFTNDAMRWGTETEPQARSAYAKAHNLEVIETGFINHPEIIDAGASPDGLVGDRGLVEIKCPNTATHLDTLLSGSIPAKYITQMHWQMACTGREWCDFVSYDPRLPGEMALFVKRVERDLSMVLDLETEVAAFLREIAEKVERLRGLYRVEEAA